VAKKRFKMPGFSLSVSLVNIPVACLEGASNDRRRAYRKSGRIGGEVNFKRKKPKPIKTTTCFYCSSKTAVQKVKSLKARAIFQNALAEVGLEKCFTHKVK
jgi:hypothetical protein